MFRKGVIVLVPFPFTDLSDNKVRPGVIVSDALEGDNIVIAFISSKVKDKIRGTEVLITEKDKDFSSTGLKVSSIIKCDHLATLEKKIVLGELGSLKPTHLKMLNTSLKNVFGWK